MFRNKILRWHTFRVVLLTSIVWMLFGFGVLVYYMNGNFMVNNSQVMITNQRPKAEARIHKLNEPPLGKFRRNKNSQFDAQSSSDANEQTPLPPYSVDQLKTWSPPDVKNNPKDWPGNSLLNLVVIF